MDYTTIKNEHERYSWACGRLAGLIGTTRYELSEEFRNELKEILYVLENN